MIQNLAAVGYDNNNMHLAAYDWRLSFQDLERRDRFFSRLKSSIELMASDGEKVTIVAHSMGNLVFKHFLGWVSHPSGGGADELWADRHLSNWIDIAGPLLGVPQTIPALLSGEMRNTAHLNAFASNLLEVILGRQDRADLFRTWGTVPGLSPRGGEIIWGKQGELAPDEPRDDAADPSFSSLITVRVDSRSGDASGASESEGDEDQDMQCFSPIPTDASSSSDSGTDPSTFNLTVSTAWPAVYSAAGEPYASRWKDSYDYSLAQTRSDLREARDRPAAWSNSLLAPLPKFPSGTFRLYSFYGVGRMTERKFFYAASPDAEEGTGRQCTKNGGWGFTIDTTYQDPEKSVINGVQMGDGDVTVPLLSSGYMCAKGWKHSRYNPSLVPCTTREHVDSRSRSKSNDNVDAESAEHTDILNNHNLISDIIRVVTGQDAESPMQSRYHSDILDIAERIKLPDGLDD
ncbi:hypothetical protein HK102_006623 [Quaeritorhiza haematococci]|nr:hypothetical protein HK102_006623 [Quaeritorhiza haematococci]